MRTYRIRVVFNLLKNFKEIKCLRKERYRIIVTSLARTKATKVFLHLKMRADTKSLQTLDKELLKMVYVNKYRYKTFISFREAILRLKFARLEALH